MNVEDILRDKQARVISVRLDETVADAARLLHRERVSALVVQDVVDTEGITLVGMFSEGDLVRVLAEQGPAALETSVADFMSQHTVTCAPQDTLKHSLNLMLDHHIRHLPVVAGFTLIGVISMRDIILALSAVSDTAEQAEKVV